MGIDSTGELQATWRSTRVGRRRLERDAGRRRAERGRWDPVPEREVLLGRGA